MLNALGFRRQRFANRVFPKPVDKIRYPVGKLDVERHKAVRVQRFEIIY
jgi:hypothetical protein